MSAGQMHKLFQERLRALEAAILANLTYLGERCVNVARSVDSYRDQTGNLRNSVGYVIVHNGLVVRQNFQRTASVTVTGAGGKTSRTKGSRDGLSAGQTFAKQLAEEFASGWVLIVVAGMNYAAAVESRGQDVLTSAEQFAQTELPRMLGELKLDVASLA